MIYKLSFAFSFLLAAGLLAASHYDLFQWNVDWFGGLSYFIAGIIFVPATALFFGVFAAVLGKKGRFTSFCKASILSLTAMIIPIGIGYTYQKIMIAEAVRQDNVRSAEFYKPHGISDKQVVQNDPTVALTSKPIIIVNSIPNLYNMGLTGTLTLGQPLTIVALVRNEFIPESHTISVKLMTIKKNSIERISLFEGVLLPSPNQSPEPGTTAFKGEIVLMDNSEASSLQWLVVEGKDRISAVMDIQIKPEQIPETNKVTQ